MIWARTSRHAQSRRMVPVFWGMSGWNKVNSIMVVFLRNV